ncbi:MAG: hypothetical protein V3T83_09080 [Acidobacteriota bacterium]
MQAYRASATVERDRALHITDVPFQPGSIVEVIVLDPRSGVAGPRQEESSLVPSAVASAPHQDREKAERILSLAGSWADMPEEEYDSLCQEIEERRRRAGAERQRREGGID